MSACGRSWPRLGGHGFTSPTPPAQRHFPPRWTLSHSLRDPHSSSAPSGQVPRQDHDRWCKTSLQPAVHPAPNPWTKITASGRRRRQLPLTPSGIARRLRRSLPQMSTEMERRGGEPATGVLRVGTWNISHWSRPKAERAAFEVPFDILAVQETHLASVPLEHAHTTAKTLELHLHHGRPVPASGHSIHGRACGVGFLVRRGLAVTPALPMGAAGRRLHAMGRWHAIRVAPRPDLPHGLLLASIYAPLESTRRGADRMQWNALMLEHLHGLDMQIPTLLLGGFQWLGAPGA